MIAANSWKSALRVRVTVLAVTLLFAGATLRSQGTTERPPRMPELMPLPAEVTLGTGRLPVTNAFSVAVTSFNDARLQAAITRLRDRLAARTGFTWAGNPAAGSGPTVTIICDGPGLSVPALGENESYALEIAAGGAVLRAGTVVGAMHGLETLLQCVQQDGASFFLPVITIRDHPRFAWRGLMIDPCRHWQPLEMVLRNLDAMAVVKLNVLHLHLTDDQGFRVESRTHPELAEKGADGHFYTQDQIRRIIAYAAQRGIRVVPEFDLPGHAQAWTVSHPEFASGPGPYVLDPVWASNVVLDPTNEALYPFLDEFFGEMAELFPDAYMHIGGDENNGRQWNANARIQQYIHDHNLADNAALQTWFNQRIVEIFTRHGKKMIGWDEIQNPQLPKSATIHAWRSRARLEDAVRAGYTAILSNGYYIDLVQPAAVHYLNDPLPLGTTLTPEEQQRVIGGEATMWSEWVTSETVDSRIWPRTAAIAERFWSPATVRDVPDMYRRLAVVSARLEEAGAEHEANREPMLRRLVGMNLAETDATALRSFVDDVEPVKLRRRARLQRDVTTATPLTGLVDCARVESPTAQSFAADVDALLASDPINPRAIDSLLRAVEARRQAAIIVEERLAVQCVRLKDVAPIAHRYVQACDIAVRALNALAAAVAPSTEWMNAELEALDAAAEPNASAIELPILPSIRLLVVAAVQQENRTAMGSDAWLAEVRQKAAPRMPNDARPPARAPRTVPPAAAGTPH